MSPLEIVLVSVLGQSTGWGLSMWFGFKQTEYRYQEVPSDCAFGWAFVCAFGWPIMLLPQFLICLQRGQFQLPRVTLSRKTRQERRLTKQVERKRLVAENVTRLRSENEALDRQISGL